jgi:anti-sigma factor RsiW
MAENPACQQFLPLLSPFVDGELTPSERVLVEQHVASCGACPKRVADFRAASGLVRLGLERVADEADFSGFAQGVMARLTPQRPPLWERIRLGWSESWQHQRGRFAGGFAVAVVLAIALPVGYRAQLASQAPLPHLAVRSVIVDPGAHVAPVVMTNDQTGDAIIWLVDHEDHPARAPDESSLDEAPARDETHTPPASRLPRDQPSGGDL